jgi:Leucine-rich repeat (LRR) protein
LCIAAHGTNASRGVNMSRIDSEDGELFIRQLATFVRTHEKALANALQFKRQNLPRHGSSQSVSSVTPLTTSTLPGVQERPSTSASTSSTLAAALSLGSLNFTSHNVKSAKLALTPHHLFYLLSRFEDLGIPVGPMKVRLESLHDNRASGNYVSFLGQTPRTKSRASDVGSIRSVSSVRSVMSGMSALWASLGLASGNAAAREERQKAALQADMKYLYSAFTKIPCLRLAPDWRARLIRGYEEFPFDSAVPIYVFKNVQALEISDIDFRQFFGWDRLADQLRSLTLRRASIEDPAEVLIDIVLDDMDKRRRRSSKSQHSPSSQWIGSSSPRRSPATTHAELHRATSMSQSSPEVRFAQSSDLQVGSAGSEAVADGDDAKPPQRPSLVRIGTDGEPDVNADNKVARPRSQSPRRPTSSRNGSAHVRASYKMKRSGSGSSNSSLSESWHNRSGSTSNLLAMGFLPASKWRFLKHLSMADNSLTSIQASSLSPLSNTLHSLDLSSNLFSQIPDSLATLTSLRALNLSNCMIDSLHSLTRNPLPAITALNLRSNRLQAIAGIERLLPLERLDLRNNRLSDPTELARLTGMPEIREVWVDGNPFTRSHRNYRVTIFNLFRKAPGYTDDILIDGTGPSYSEKRQLVDRADEPSAVPVVKPSVPDYPAVDVSKPAIIYDQPKEQNVLRKERPQLKSVTSEVNTTATRRKKTPKRRIVDLATNDAFVSGSPPARSSIEANPLVAAPATFSAYSLSQSPQMPPATESVAESPLRHGDLGIHVPRAETIRAESSPGAAAEENREPSSPAASLNWDVGGEAYRRKIEELRDKVGNSYLSVLREEAWDSSSSQKHTYSGAGLDGLANSPMSPPMGPLGVTHSARTLG